MLPLPGSVGTPGLFFLFSFSIRTHVHYHPRRRLSTADSPLLLFCLIRTLTYVVTNNRVTTYCSPVSRSVYNKRSCHCSLPFLCTIAYPRHCSLSQSVYNNPPLHCPTSPSRCTIMDSQMPSVVYKDPLQRGSPPLLSSCIIPLYYHLYRFNGNPPPLKPYSLPSATPLG